MNAMGGEFDTDVLIVGSGPTGATTALALATYGVRAHMVSRWNWLAEQPAARKDGTTLYVHASPRDPLYEYVEEASQAIDGVVKFIQQHQ